VNTRDPGRRVREPEDRVKDSGQRALDAVFPNEHFLDPTQLTKITSALLPQMRYQSNGGLDALFGLDFTYPVHADHHGDEIIDDREERRTLVVQHLRRDRDSDPAPEHARKCLTYERVSFCGDPGFMVQPDQISAGVDLLEPGEASVHDIRPSALWAPRSHRSIERPYVVRLDPLASAEPGARVIGERAERARVAGEERARKSKPFHDQQLAIEAFNLKGRSISHGLEAGEPTEWGRSRTPTRQGDSAMTKIRADRTRYAIDRRYQSKKGGKPLKGFALDITIRFNTDGHPFLQDHNSNGPMPFNTVDELQDFVAQEIARNYSEHFVGSSTP
jgi:hypothetical protein